MTEITIPCETITRMTKILKYLPDYADEWVNTIRLDGDCMMVTNRAFMAVERISASVPTPVHIIAHPELLEKCEAEAQFSGQLYLIINEILGIITAKTTFGYTCPDNLLMNSLEPNELDRWRDIIPNEVATSSKGGMMLDLRYFTMLAESAPSKQIIFEEHIDITRPTIIRDMVDPEWFGVFNPKDLHRIHDPAKLPEWFK